MWQYRNYKSENEMKIKKIIIEFEDREAVCFNIGKKDHCELRLENEVFDRDSGRGYIEKKYSGKSVLTFEIYKQPKK